MKALVIYFDTYLSIIDKLAKLDIVDIIWNEDNFVIWYNLIVKDVLSTIRAKIELIKEYIV